MGVANNQHASKWTLAKAQQFLVDLYEHCKANKDDITIEKAVAALNSYETLPNYLKVKYGEELDFEPYKKAMTICKSCLSENGLKGKYQVAMAIFLLKKNHDMDDTIDVQSGGKPVSISPIMWTDGSGKD